MRLPIRTQHEENFCMRKFEPEPFGPELVTVQWHHAGGASN